MLQCLLHIVIYSFKNVLSIFSSVGMKIKYLKSIRILFFNKMLSNTNLSCCTTIHLEEHSLKTQSVDAGINNTTEG